MQLIILCMALVGCALGQSCPSGWTQNVNYCYIVIAGANTITHSNAEAACLQQRGESEWYNAICVTAIYFGKRS